VNILRFKNKERGYRFRQLLKQHAPKFKLIFNKILKMYLKIPYFKVNKESNLQTTRSNCNLRKLPKKSKYAKIALTATQ
jgi:hypothetical protein